MPALATGQRVSRIPRAPSNIEETLHLQLRADHQENGTQLPVREHRFHPTREWRFDFAWPGRKVAVECEGITHEGGRHQRLAGFEQDCEKYNAAAVEGWLVLRFTARMVRKNAALEVILKCLGEW